MYETNAVQLTNRAPIAHLAIERGLKVLIDDAGGTAEDIHSLNTLFRELGKWDASSADYLVKAFDDAVNFFGYNVNVSRFGHFRSLYDYLSKTGTENAFKAFRYWARGESSKVDPIPFISPPVHRELLCALCCLFIPNRRETVSDRVEREVGHSMFSGRHISYVPTTPKKQSVQWYKNWLFNTHTSRRTALEDAVDKGFSVTDDDSSLRLCGTRSTSSGNRKTPLSNTTSAHSPICPKALNDETLTPFLKSRGIKKIKAVAS